MDVKIELCTRDCIIASWDGLGLGVWRGKTTVETVRRAGQILTEYARARQRRLLLLTLVEQNAPLPSIEARTELVSFLKAANGYVERHGLVFEGEGFRAASIRALVAGVALFSRPEYPYRILGSVSAAARFIASGNGAPSPHRTIQMVAEARRAAGTQSAEPWFAGASNQAVSQQAVSSQLESLRR
jgi:hypothetical protein